MTITSIRKSASTADPVTLLAANSELEIGIGMERSSSSIECRAGQIYIQCCCGCLGTCSANISGMNNDRVRSFASRRVVWKGVFRQYSLISSASPPLPTFGGWPRGGGNKNVRNRQRNFRAGEFGAFFVRRRIKSYPHKYIKSEAGPLIARLSTVRGMVGSEELDG